MKRRWHEASLHRQWGKEAAIAWTIGLCNLYQDRSGLRLGIGDNSHVPTSKLHGNSTKIKSGSLAPNMTG